MTGGASGALTGLLFVAVSLSRERIAGHPALRGQAGQTLVLLVLPLLLAVVLVLPGASRSALGGCLQLAGDDELYWVAAAGTLSLVGGGVNAWVFLTRS